VQQAVTVPQASPNVGPDSRRGTRAIEGQGRKSCPIGHNRRGLTQLTVPILATGVAIGAGLGTGEDELDGGDVIPGFRTVVSDLFEV
jgi:hypothetical protein